MSTQIEFPQRQVTTVTIAFVLSNNPDGRKGKIKYSTFAFEVLSLHMRTIISQTRF